VAQLVSFEDGIGRSKQLHESGLPEMVIRCQRLVYATLLHENETCTVNHPPGFVGTPTIQLPAFLMQSLVDPNEFADSRFPTATFQLDRHIPMLRRC
jgi:hypothetical protein